MLKEHYHLYDALMLPLEVMVLRELRREILQFASGRALEVGTGTGANLNYYPFHRIDELVLTDTEPCLDLGRFSVPENISLTVQRADVMHLPFAASSFDTVVFTLVFCCVSDPAAGLQEVYRVLKPGGRICFVEHVLPKKPILQKIASKLDSWWHLRTGCSLTRTTLVALQEVGFKLRQYRFTLGDMLVAGVAEKSPV